jgi:hypothetical protein
MTPQEHCDHDGGGAVDLPKDTAARAALSVIGVVSVEPVTTSINGVQDDYQSPFAARILVELAGITVGTY